MITFKRNAKIKTFCFVRKNLRCRKRNKHDRNHDNINIFTFHGTRREIKFWEQDVSSISIRNFSFPNGHVMFCLLYMDVDGTSKFNEINVLGFYSFSMR